MGKLGFKKKLKENEHTGETTDQKKEKTEKQCQPLQTAQTEISTFDITSITSKVDVNKYTKMLLKDCTPWFEKVAFVLGQDSYKSFKKGFG